MDKLANVLQKLDRIESFLGSVTSMQVQLPTAWRDINKSVPVEGVPVLLHSAYLLYPVVVGIRTGDKFVPVIPRKEFEVVAQYWMPLPPSPWENDE